MLIRAGKRDCGTFHFYITELAAAVTTQNVKAYELWHRRMGHSSVRVVSSLSNIFVSVDFDVSNKACDVCLCAKQTRSCFPASINKTKYIFD